MLFFLILLGSSSKWDFAHFIFPALTLLLTFLPLIFSLTQDLFVHILKQLPSVRFYVLLHLLYLCFPFTNGRVFGLTVVFHLVAED